MSAFGKLLLLISLPFLFMFLVNALSPRATFELRESLCTRWCEQHGCIHFNKKFSSTEELLSKWWYQLYRWNVKSLNTVPVLNYSEANIAVYFIFYPLAIFILLFRLLKKKR